MQLAVTSIAKYYKKFDEKVTLKLATFFLTKENLKEESLLPENKGPYNFNMNMAGCSWLSIKVFHGKK